MSPIMFCALLFFGLVFASHTHSSQNQLPLKLFESDSKLKLSQKKLPQMQPSPFKPEYSNYSGVNSPQIAQISINKQKQKPTEIDNSKIKPQYSENIGVNTKQSEKKYLRFSEKQLGKQERKMNDSEINSNGRKQIPKIVRKNVKIGSKLPPIFNIEHKKSKINWAGSIKVGDINNDEEQRLKIMEKANKQVYQLHNKQHLASQIQQISSHLIKPIQRTSSTNFLYQLGFEYPKLSQNQNTKIFNESIDQFSPPIEISSGSAFENRLKTQFAILSKQISTIQRHFKLKPGKYNLKFDWQSSEPNGQFFVFWNHRLLASYKSSDILAKQQTIHIQSQQGCCFKEDNILKFKIGGQISIGIDNIQVIN